MNTDLIKNMIKEAKKASASLPRLDAEKNADILRKVAKRLSEEEQKILSCNIADLLRMNPENPDYDRLRLTPDRLRNIASDMEAVASLPIPFGNVISQSERPNGMVIRKVSVPFGVIGVIYEARPNVTADVFSLCFRSGSACVLKGGHDADHSSGAIVDVIHSVLREEGLPEALCTLLPAERESASIMMEAVGDIDVIIPRGGRGLIDYVRTHSRVPVIETGAGVCHTYIDSSADLDKSRDVVCNAKTRRVSVCNALDCLVINSERLADLPTICAPLAEKKVVIFADAPAYARLSGRYPGSLLREADSESFGTEFRDYKMAIKTVDSLDEALEHIATYGSHHSECILSETAENIERFQREVDASCVYANVSTAFTDGAQFGFGAEIGISTQKLHARGPMALPELTTYKYLISGNGQTRNP
ncbi:MAG: glutamate-5-semialdehyde dehydrogenase [Muribaculaceae bacterium]|nr:glutamate-5-semialdehyde dehydrogenase [Muribaculaceae bacterium]